MRRTPTVDWQMGAVVFIDVVGSTELILGAPRAASGMLIGYVRSATRLAREGGALVVQGIGDGVVAIFATSTEAANYASRAAVKAVAFDKQYRTAKPFRIRIGIATGELAVTPEVIGATVNLAARLASLAEPNTILCDQATGTLASRLPGRWRETTKRLKLKGLPKVLPVYERAFDNASRQRTVASDRTKARVLLHSAGR
jgi:class 3 adenylate cyclase